MTKDFGFRGMSEEQVAEYERNAICVDGSRDEETVRRLSDQVREIAYQLHLYLGTGFLEKVYENALKHRLEKAGLSVRQQVPVAVYDEDGYRIGFYVVDLLVEGMLILELKAIRALEPANVAQLVNYLKATHVRDGMLINFGSQKFEVTKRVL